MNQHCTTRSRRDRRYRHRRRRGCISGFSISTAGSGGRFGSIGLAISGLERRSRSRRANTCASGTGHRSRAPLFRADATVLALEGAHELRWRNLFPRMQDLVPAHNSRWRSAACGVCMDCRSISGRCGRLGRGTVGHGIGLFQRGGLVVDGGRGRTTRSGADHQPACPFPSAGAFWSWSTRVRQGVHGRDESDAFAALPPLQRKPTWRICAVCWSCNVAGAWPSRSAKLRRRDQGYAAAARRLFCAGPGRLVIQVLASPLRLICSARRRGRHRPKFLGSDRICIRAVDRGGGDAWCTVARQNRAHGVWTSGFARGSIPAQRSSPSALAGDPARMECVGGGHGGQAYPSHGHPDQTHQSV